MPPGPREWRFGTHTLSFEPPDVFWARFQGTLTLESVRGAVAAYQELSEVRPFFFVAFVKEAHALDPEAARYMSEHLPSSWMVANIYIGSRLLHKALAKGIALASKLYPHAEENVFEKIHHVDTEADARALIARLRVRYARPLP